MPVSLNVCHFLPSSREGTNDQNLSNLFIPNLIALVNPPNSNLNFRRCETVLLSRKTFFCIPIQVSNVIRPLSIRKLALKLGSEFTQ